MSCNKILVLCLVGVLFLATGIILWAAFPRPVLAQCGDNPPISSCTTCHEKEDPVLGKGDWHDIHASKDICVQCHGGNTSTMDKQLAHMGLVANPLNDIYTDCSCCHPDDYQARAEHFAVLLGVTPGSSPTATPLPALALVSHPIVILPESAAPAVTYQAGLLAFLGIVLFGLIALGIEFGYIFSHNPTKPTKNTL